ncbi:MAG: M67 family metallopeptidase [Candidatus Thorarchaeota archaeon]|jgi:proteasome lid subunit RPN8/RPN11
MLQYTLRLSKGNFEQIYNHAEANLPFEAVALLFGRVENESITVTNISLVDNKAKSRTSFEVDPEEEYKLLLEAEDRGEEMVCIFHSHPAPTTPSPSDLRNMKLNPVIWLIASKITGQWESRAFTLNEEEILEVVIKIEDTTSST